MTEQPDTPRGRMKWKRIVLAWLPLLLVVLFFGWRGALKLRVSRELAWYRARGYPTTRQELNARYVRPKGENAADTYQQAFDAYAPLAHHSPLPFVGKGKPPPLGQPLPAKTAKLAEEFLRENATALGYLRQAVEVKACRFPVNLSDPNASWTQLPDLQHGGDILSLEALVRAGQGKERETFEALDVLFRIGQALEREPIPVSQRVREWLNCSAVKALERALNLCSLSDARLRALDERMAEIDLTEGLERGLVGVVPLTLDELNREAPKFWRGNGVMGRLWALALAKVYVPSGARDMDRAFHLRRMRQAIGLPGTPWPKASRTVQSVVKAGRDAPGLLAYSRMAGLLADGAVDCEARWSARRATARAAVAVQRFRLKHGRLPNKLADLVPDYLKTVPADPYTGKPVVYRKLKKGFIVYAVGPNGKDDAGRDAGDKPPGDDISFRILRDPPKKGKGK